MTELVTKLAAASLAVTFGWAASYKLVRFPRWRSALEPYGLPGPIRIVALVGVPLAELAVTVSMVLGATSAGAAFSLVLLALFCAALLRARTLQGDKVPCGCFGKSEDRDYRLLLSRNALLSIVAAVALLLDNGSGARIPVTELLPAALALGGIALIGWMALQASTSMRRK